MGMPVAKATPPATEANLGICLKQGRVGHGTSEIGFGSAREAEIGHAQARQVFNESAICIGARNRIDEFFLGMAGCLNLGSLG